ncbi:MAG: FeoA family protein [Desulfovibrionaceae bacterium]
MPTQPSPRYSLVPADPPSASPHSLCCPPVSPEGEISLCALEVGQSAQIRAVRARGELGRRLMDMGLLPGVCLTLFRRAPLGDPIAVSLEDCTLSLRCAEAAQIIVDPV